MHHASSIEAIASHSSLAKQPLMKMHIHILFFSLNLNPEHLVHCQFLMHLSRMNKKCRILIRILLLISMRSHPYVESRKTKQEQSKIFNKFQKDKKWSQCRKCNWKRSKNKRKQRLKMNSIKHKCRKHEESWKWWMINDEDEEGKRNATKSVRKRLWIVRRRNLIPY